MATESRKQFSRRKDIIGWVLLGIALVAAIILDQYGTIGKWHASIEWTGTAFYGLMVFGSSQWRLRGFWLFWVACLSVHVFIMWILFARLLPTLRVGTLYVIPVGFVESILLLGMFGSLKQKIRRISLQGKVD